MHFMDQIKVEILTVGSEITKGHIIDSNSQWLAELLTLNGFKVCYITTAGDYLEDIGIAVREALARCDSVIITGGLGPTQDDLTREAVSQALGLELKYDEVIEKRLREIFAKSKYKMAESNLKQAYVINGSQIIDQKVGTAPGMILMVGKKPLYLLPGVPAEMKEMTQRAVLPHLLNTFGLKASYLQKTFSLWGITESRLADLLTEFNDKASAYGFDLAFQASFAQGIKIRLNKVATQRQDDEHFSTLVKELETKLKSWIFSDSENTLEEELIKVLTEHKNTISVVESLTGGLVSQRIVSVQGASKVFKGSLVAYSLETKNKMLDLNLKASVSKDAALLLAATSAEKFQTDWALSTTGVAGPDSLEGYQPGKVFIGIYGKIQSVVELDLIGDRNRIRQTAASEAINLARKSILDTIH
jgi:nicotinamide-nucleotide amidase